MQWRGAGDNFAEIVPEAPCLKLQSTTASASHQAYQPQYTMGVPFEALIPYGIMLTVCGNLSCNNGSQWLIWEQMFSITGAGLSKIRNMQNGGKRQRHGIDTWDKVCWTDTTLPEIQLTPCSKVGFSAKVYHTTESDVHHSDGARSKIDRVFERTIGPAQSTGGLRTEQWLEGERRIHQQCDSH